MPSPPWPVIGDLWQCLRNSKEPIRRTLSITWMWQEQPQQSAGGWPAPARQRRASQCWPKASICCRKIMIGIVRTRTFHTGWDKITSGGEKSLIKRETLAKRYENTVVAPAVLRVYRTQE